MTPVRQQYLRIKNQFPNTIVMFRLGYFYETFDDDAKTVASVCNIVLTGRDMGTGPRVPLAGVPYHAVESYLAKLIQAGHKVAIVEQTGDVVNGLMPRQVAQNVTPKGFDLPMQGKASFSPSRATTPSEWYLRLVRDLVMTRSRFQE